MELKKRKEEIDKEVEAQWLELERLKMDDYDERLRTKLEEQLHKK